MVSRIQMHDLLKNKKKPDCRHFKKIYTDPFKWFKHLDSYFYTIIFKILFYYLKWLLQFINYEAKTNCHFIARIQLSNSFGNRRLLPLMLSFLKTFCSVESAKKKEFHFFFSLNSKKVASKNFQFKIQTAHRASHFFNE